MSGPVEGSGGPVGDLLQVCFPEAQSSVLDSLNRQREDGQLCDLSIQVQGQVFRAHRCVLAASSPYFHDQVLCVCVCVCVRDGSLFFVLFPLFFSLLSQRRWLYCNQPTVSMSVVVTPLSPPPPPCPQVLLKNMSTVCIPAVMDPVAFESVLSCAYTGRLEMARDDIVSHLTVGSVLQMWRIVDKCTELLKESRAPGGGGGGGVCEAGAEPASISGAEGSRAGSVSGVTAERQAAASKEEREAPLPPSRLALSESQSPSSTNYFSPRHGNGLGGGGATGAGASGEGGGANATPSYCTPSGGEEEVGVSDSFGVSSYQGGEERRGGGGGYSQSGPAPRKQWVVVKTEQPEDDDLILVERERNDFNISNVRSLSSASHMDSQSDYCQSSEDYLRLETSLMEHTLAQHLHEAQGLAQGPGRAVSSLLGQQVQTVGAARGQLFPLDMQGNPILLYSQNPGISSLDPGRDAAGGLSFKGHHHLEHGAVHLAGLVPDAMDPSGMGGGASGDGVGASGKLFMCHCGKTFSHRSMRDRHVNMHLDLRPFHCPVCSKKFKMKHHLTEHMKTHTGLKPYRCEGCARNFMWRDSYMRHRAQCERGGVGEDPSPHFLLPSEEGGAGGGRGHRSDGGMSGSAGAASQGGTGEGRRDEDPREAGAADGSVT
ncbi:hypothetical protein NHX12_023551 [Muraenolepis orangiensis]|uniref:Zinc finger and BTB domain containing 22b n=1 Tax=Muraenolepis orangiensis TaxID=630683 RepID=A0A9Q0IS63_9TELE|nr:hypothetical protein NHX12_023551 [Muraenolepis orangiensis]